MPPSTVESLSRIRRRMVERIDALRPAVEEHDRLLAALPVLDSKPEHTPAPVSVVAVPATTDTKPPAPRRRSQAAAGRRRDRTPRTDQVIDMLHKQPMTRGDLASRLGQSGPALGNTLQHLKRDGRVRRIGEQWHAINGAAGGPDSATATTNGATAEPQEEARETTLAVDGEPVVS